MKQRDRLAAALLAFFLGGIGAHWFYVGRSDYGITYLIIGGVSFLLSFIIVGLFGFLILGGLCLYDGIRFLAMTPERFDVEYNSAFLL